LATNPLTAPTPSPSVPDVLENTHIRNAPVKHQPQLAVTVANSIVLHSKNARASLNPNKHSPTPLKTVFFTEMLLRQIHQTLLKPPPHPYTLQNKHPPKLILPLKLKLPLKPKLKLKYSRTRQNQ
jgi:hypothetical protein